MSQSSSRSLVVLGLFAVFAAGCGESSPVPPPTPVPARPAEAKCPVCGDPVSAERAVPVTVGGTTTPTCSNGCAARLRASPEKFGPK